MMNSGLEGHDFTENDSEEEWEAEWVNNVYFPVGHVLDEYKSQARRAMKEPLIEEPNS